MKVEMSSETYQVGAHFKALIMAIPVAPLKSFERVFFAFRVPLPVCEQETCQSNLKAPKFKRDPLCTGPIIAEQNISIHKTAPTGIK